MRRDLETLRHIFIGRDCLADVRYLEPSIKVVAMLLRSLANFVRPRYVMTLYYGQV